MIKNFMMITSAVLALFVAGGLMLSNEYEIRESKTINVPVEKIHELVGDLQQWNQWDPWQADDKTLKTEVSQATGKGASQKWVSEHGRGSLMITDSDSKRGISYELRFGSSNNISYAGFEYTPSGDRTVVTWYIRGKVSTPVIGGYVAALSSSNTSMLKKGLDNLKKLAEGL